MISPPPGTAAAGSKVGGGQDENGNRLCEFEAPDDNGNRPVFAPETPGNKACQNGAKATNVHCLHWGFLQSVPFTRERSPMWRKTTETEESSRSVRSFGVGS